MHVVTKFYRYLHWQFFFCFDQGPFSSPKKVIFVCKSLLQPKIIRLVTFYSDQTRLNLWFLPAQDPVLKCSILECAMCIQSILQYTILILVSLGQSLWQPESSIHSVALDEAYCIVREKYRSSSMIITALRRIFNFYAFFIPVNSGKLTRIIPQCSEIIFLFLLNVFSYYCGRRFCIYRHYFSQSGVPISIYEGDYLCVVSCSNDIGRCEMNWSLHLVSHFIHKCT